MTNDFAQTETKSASAWDQRWMASNRGLALGKTHTLDLTADKGIPAVIKDGEVKAGTAVGLIDNTSPERYGLFDPTATDGRQVHAGFVLANIDVTNADNVTIQKSLKAPFSLLDQGDIKRNFLPVEAQRSQLTYLTVSRGQFIYVS